MKTKQLPLLILVTLFCSLSNGQNSEESDSFDIWSFFNDKILLTFDDMIGQFVTLIDSMDHYINHSWDKVMMAMDRLVDHAREEDCYYACPKGLRPVPKSGFRARPLGCHVFGYEVNINCVNFSQIIFDHHRFLRNI